MAIPVVQAHAINHVPRHAHDRHAQRTQPVPTAVNQRVVPNITVVHAMHRHQHVQLAYLAMPAITKATAVVHLVQPSVRRTYHKGATAIQPARN